jgi:hypothetical protein
VDVFFSDFAANLGGAKNPLYQLHDGLKAEGARVTDLVRGNVNEHGIVYPPDVLAEILTAQPERARVLPPGFPGTAARA